MVTLAIPFLSMRLGSSDQGKTRRGPPPARPTTCWPRASDRATTDHSNSSPGVTAALEGERSPRHGRSVGGQPTWLRSPPRYPSRPQAPPGRLSPTSTRPVSPQDASTSELLTHLRNTTIPGHDGQWHTGAHRRADGDLRGLRSSGARANCRCSSGSSSCCRPCCSPSCSAAL